MSESSNSKRIARIVECAEEHFGKEVERVTAPGGEGRSSFRLHFDDRDVIATLRPNFRRTHLEAHVLNSLNTYSSDLPRVLGVVGEILFQSDVGRRRLNQEIVRCPAGSQKDLAAEAVAGIFRIHAAARKTDLHKMMPHLGNNAEWISNLVDAVDALQPYSQGISGDYDRAAVGNAIAYPGKQFVKWDCRSGNAAIGQDERLRWFDFEYSGLRHGAEDFAWLIGDEAWPIAPDVMVDIMIDAYDHECGHEISDYLEYMSVYLTLHAVQRFKLIVKEAKKRGWLSKERVRKYDDAGVHPEFAVQICKVGQYFAAQSPLTAPLSRNFEGAARAFKEILRDGSSLKSA
ncbi:hypothetical protein QEZ52_05495 [Aliisedimentitalea scapharcae]|uniref:Aminoglycoside phosphotransferase domain-containing protein n=1 Tax=Aliisedimentitalea scapharcae TaxID=1524259 RepID=A0ABZ2XYV6_9RHOB|nr:hypothetical protein K3727_05400 [Rhodobacteraceae bacterium M382]